jgi:hypothetical protein
MNDGENNVTTSQEDRYAEVSLRAVELLAKAQRAADEAVAEAQSYARDLEKSARDQYRQILQRAQTAAQQVAHAEGARGEQVGAGGSSAVDAQQLAYVRTYARVAHTQLKSVLAALNDELDQLAAMADGSAGSPAPGLNLSAAPAPSVPPAAPPGLPQAPREAPGTYGSSLGYPPAEPARPSAAEPPWRPSERPAPPARPSGNHPTHETNETNGAPAWPPIAAGTSSISYFHRGSSWEGPA